MRSGVRKGNSAVQATPFARFFGLVAHAKFCVACSGHFALGTRRAVGHSRRRRSATCARARAPAPTAQLAALRCPPHDGHVPCVVRRCSDPLVLVSALCPGTGELRCAQSLQSDNRVAWTASCAMWMCCAVVALACCDELLGVSAKHFASPIGGVGPDQGAQAHSSRVQQRALPMLRGVRFLGLRARLRSSPSLPSGDGPRQVTAACGRVATPQASLTKEQPRRLVK